MPKTILVIDPQELVRGVLSDILQRSGYAVCQAADLAQALDLLQDCRPDLVVTNVYIPGGSGRDAARQLRAVCPGVRLLIVAGLPDDHFIREHWDEADNLEVFPKPFTAGELRYRVRTLLDAVNT